MNTVTISNDKMSISIFRYTESDFPADERDLQGAPVEIEINISSHKSRIWFDNKDEFEFFIAAIASYCDDFKKGGTV